MTLIKKQVFLRSKDENLQQFLAKAGDKANLDDYSDKTPTAPRSVSPEKSKQGKMTLNEKSSGDKVNLVSESAFKKRHQEGKKAYDAKKAKQWPKDKPDPSGRDYPGELEDREYQKAFEVDPEGGAKQYDQKERDAKRQRILDHSWKYVKNLEDQGSDNSNTADDKASLKKAKGDATRVFSPRHAKAKIEEQDYKDWQREQAASEKSKATIGDNVDPATIVTKAIQDAWFEKAGSLKAPHTATTTKNVKFTERTIKDPRRSDFEPVGSSETRQNTIPRGNKSPNQRGPWTARQPRPDKYKNIDRATVRKASEDKPKTDTSVRESDVNYPNKRDGSIDERSKSFAESHTALYGGSPKRAAKRFRARLGRQVSSAEARRTREALPSDQQKNITAASKKKQTEARADDPDERWASPRNNPNWDIRGQRADIEATEEEVSRQKRGDLTDAEVVNRDWPLTGQQVGWNEGEGAYRRMTPDQKAKYKRQTHLGQSPLKRASTPVKKAVEDAWLEKIQLRKPKTHKEKMADFERTQAALAKPKEKAKEGVEAVKRGAKAVKRGVEETGVRNPLRNPFYRKRPKNAEGRVTQMRPGSEKNRLRSTLVEDAKKAGPQMRPGSEKKGPGAWDSRTQPGGDIYERDKKAKTKVGNEKKKGPQGASSTPKVGNEKKAWTLDEDMEINFDKKKSNYESGPSTPEEQYQADKKKAIQGELIDMNSIQQGVYDAWIEKQGDATAADAAKASLKIREDLEAKAAAEEQAEKDYKASKDHSRYSRYPDVSETGGHPPKWEGEENPPRPKGQ
jgi:hypothetical protein